MTVYKVLDEKGRPYHGGTGKWPLPSRGKPGKWLAVEGDIIPCVSGLHLCRPQDLVHWLGPVIFEAEYDESEACVVADAKIAVRRARLVRRVDTWNKRTARLFAADCADRALRQTAKATGQKADPRSRAAVRAAREFAKGTISAAELAAARAAARAAAWAVVAARDAAWAAERIWQTKRLFEYLDGKRG